MNKPLMNIQQLGFAWRLYKAMNPTGNLLIAPGSIWTCLTMAFLGANGETRTEMEKVLGLENMPDEVIVRQLMQMAESISSVRNIIIASAACVYAEQDYEFIQAYLDLMANIAGIKRVDFKHDAEAVRREINDWGKIQTRGMIPELFGAGTINDLTRMVLVTAIYFKADWFSQFDERLTHSAPFHSTDGDVSVGMMTQEMNHVFRRLLTDTCEAVSLPYVNPDFSMVALLPVRGMSLQEFEAALTESTLTEILEQLYNQETENIQVSMPKWTFTSEAMNLIPALQSLGMRVLFTGAADFTKMILTRELHIAQVVHKTRARFDEKGSELAGLTGANVALEMVLQTIHVHLDRPYMYLIVDWKEGVIHFIGRQEHPEFNA